MLMTILVILLILALLGGIPSTGWHSYGWGPSGAIGAILAVVIVLLVLGRL